MKSRTVILYIAILTTVTMWFSACSDDDFRMDDSFVKSKTSAEYTNQTNIELSTFRLDSVQTSNTGIVWVGRSSKPEIGNIYSESYARIALSEDLDWLKHERYDSVTMILRHTGDYVGDTTKGFTVRISQLASPLKFTEEDKSKSFYNNHAVRDTLELGSFRFRPYPHLRPRVRFRLDDNFGRSLAQFIEKHQNKPADIAQNYEHFFGGIKISADTSDAAALLSFRADSVQIELHSHVTGMKRLERIRRFWITNLDCQFNHVWNDGAPAPYNKLVKLSDKVNEREGNLHSVMFEGLGYYSRIDISAMEDILSKKYKSHVIKATLVLAVEPASYERRFLPTFFSLYEVNKWNVLNGIITDQFGKSVYGVLLDNMYDENYVYYEVDITHYLNTLLSRDYVEPGLGMAVVWDGVLNSSNFYYLHFSGHTKPKYKSNIQLYYYDYDKEDR
ncbi:MAG: DUF4270 family protein [Bacteroidales bacterium]|nr:DUF4270 family protein [Bacteroidales bacterium]